jgi:hypothetical protein
MTLVERRIIGVDFSGGGEDDQVGDTWVTEGSFDGDTTLTIDNCRRISRDDLRDLLMNLPPSAVAAMDFPFGVPQDFAHDEFGFCGDFMCEIWAIIEEIFKHKPNYIKDIRPCFRGNGRLRRFNKLLRQWDRAHFPEAFSPFNPAAPEMSPMTFLGMRMLHTLWTQTNCRVPPLHNDRRTGPVLLETMPGVILSALCLPSQKYKSYRRADQKAERLRNRYEIWDGLENILTLPVKNLDHWHKRSGNNHDCLDSVVAAIAAAMWAKDSTLFHHPEEHQGDGLRDAARLEGCIYGLKCITQ